MRPAALSRLDFLRQFDEDGERSSGIRELAQKRIIGKDEFTLEGCAANAASEAEYQGRRHFI